MQIEITANCHTVLTGPVSTVWQTVRKQGEIRRKHKVPVKDSGSLGAQSSPTGLHHQPDQSRA